MVRARPGQGVAPSTGSGGHCGHDEVLVPISLPCEPTDRIEGRHHRWATDTYTVVMDATGARILAGTSSSCSGVPVFGRCCGDAWLVTVQTDAGGARSEGSSASVGRTTHHTSSYIGSWPSPGEFRALSGSSKTSVGDVPDRSRVRPAFSDRFRCARCRFSPSTGAGHVLKVSRAWLFSAIQKVCGPGCRAPVDIEETPVGYGIVQTLDLRRDTPHPGTRWIARGRAAPGPRKERGASPASDGSSRSGEIDRCSCRGGG